MHLWEILIRKNLQDIHNMQKYSKLSKVSKGKYSLWYLDGKINLKVNKKK